MSLAAGSGPTLGRRRSYARWPLGAAVTGVLVRDSTDNGKGLTLRATPPPGRTSPPVSALTAPPANPSRDQAARRSACP